MSLQELRAVLHEHATSIDDDALVGRAAAARRRARTIQRRRAATVAAGVALVVPIAGAILVMSGPGRSGTQPQPANPTGSTSAVPLTIGDSTLIDSKVATGVSELTLTVDAWAGTDWRPACQNVGPAFLLHFTLDGSDEGSYQCDVDLVAGERGGYAIGSEAASFGSHTLRIWLTDAANVPTQGPRSGVLAAAVYQLAPPVAEVAPGYEVQELIEDGEGTWKFSRLDKSELGVRSFKSTQTVAAGGGSVDWYALGSGSSRVEIYVDGQLETTMSMGGGGPGVTVSENATHTVELRITGPVPGDALLALVWRNAAP
jgi:hypothetical protein